MSAVLKCSAVHCVPLAIAAAAAAAMLTAVGPVPHTDAHVKVQVVELTDHILHSYDKKIGQFVAKQFKRAGESTHPAN